MKKTISIVLVWGLGVAAEVAKADFAFGEPTNLGPTVNTSSMDFDSSISPDGLSLYFASDRPGGSGGKDLWVTMRPTVSDPWGQPVNLGPTVNSSAWDSCPSISADGLSIYFESNRPGGVGDQDIWVTSRLTPDSDWGSPINLGSTVNSSVWDSCPFISADGLSLYFDSYRPGGSGSCDLWVVTRATVSDPWGQPDNLGPMVNSSSWEYQPGISADGLILLFFSNRTGGSGNEDLWLTTRASTDDDWGNPVNLGPTVNSSARDVCPYISADGSTLYFTSQRSGGMGNDDLWQVSIEPIVDFNGDGIVDGFEVCLMADRWGTDDPLCDIGPMPWGDGVVGVQDLLVLAEYIGKEVDDPTLVAHWALDEADGIIATDSAGLNDGTVIGASTWLPDAGKIGGALQFSGMTFVTADAVLSPADGPFSVLAWVKGGAPGQVIVSQTTGKDWLLADSPDGSLATQLVQSARGGEPLHSEMVITDGDWHRVGFAWDGSACRLYVDDVLVAEDTQAKLADCSGGLNIGGGANLAAGSFFTGLIDDVRIYNRAVQP